MSKNAEKNDKELKAAESVKEAEPQEAPEVEETKPVAKAKASKVTADALLTELAEVVDMAENHHLGATWALDRMKAIVQEHKPE